MRFKSDGSLSTKMELTANEVKFWRDDADGYGGGNGGNGSQRGL